MFPTIRLIIVALFASIVAVCCGLAVFAAFPINHQPFTRLQATNPPLQLVYGNGAPAPIADGTVAPFGARFELIAMPPVPPATPPAAAQASVTAPIKETDVSDPIAPADRAAAPVVADQTPPAGDPVNPLAPSFQSPSVQTLLVQTPSVPAPSDSMPSSQADMTTPVPHLDSVQDAPPSAAQETDGAAKVAARTDATDAVALAPPADQPPPAVPAARDIKPAGASTTKSARAPKPTRKKTRRRIVALHHRRRLQVKTYAQSPVQEFGFAPNYQLTHSGAVQPAALEPRPPRRRVVAKPVHRASKKTALRETSPKQPAAGNGSTQQPIVGGPQQGIVGGVPQTIFGGMSGTQQTVVNGSATGARIQ